MKAKLFSLLLICSMTVMPALAASYPTVIFEGDVEKFIILNDDTEGFGETFLNMYPGESRTKSFSLKNTSDDTKTFYLNAKVNQDLQPEDGTAATGAIYDITLTRTEQFKSTTLFDGTIGGANADLTDFNNTPLNNTEGVELATLASGESTRISLTLAIDGASMGNDYQNSLGSFQLIFSTDAAQAQTSPPKSTPTIGKTTTTDSPTTSRYSPVSTLKSMTSAVQTGDMRPIIPIFLVLLLSGMIILTLIRRHRQKS